MQTAGVSDVLSGEVTHHGNQASLTSLALLMAYGQQCGAANIKPLHGSLREQPPHWLLSGASQTHREDLALVLRPIDVEHHVCGHLGVGVQNTGTIPLH